MTIDEIRARWIRPQALNYDCAAAIDIATLLAEIDRLKVELTQSNYWRRNYADAVKSVEKERDAALGRVRSLLSEWKAAPVSSRPDYFTAGKELIREECADELSKALEGGE